MTDFDVGEEAWMAKLGNLRNTIRQELIARQIVHHIEERRSVLDVGCGQGTQALRLLETGCNVVGVEPSDALIKRFRNDAAATGFEPEIQRGGIEDLHQLLGDRTFDVVCAHGLLMYLNDPPNAIQTLSDRVARGGLLSLTFKNGDGLAMRPALRGDWPLALASFSGDTYLSELGVTARAHRLDDVEAWLEASGLRLAAWYGVRVFNDAIAGDEMPPVDGSLDDLLKAEELAGRTDPYRWLGSQIHVLALRDADG